MTPQEIEVQAKEYEKQDQQLTRIYFPKVIVGSQFQTLEGHTIKSMLYEENFSYDDSEDVHLTNVFLAECGVIIVSNDIYSGQEIVQKTGIRLGSEVIIGHNGPDYFLYWSTKLGYGDSGVEHAMPSLETAIKRGVSSQALWNYAVKRTSDYQKLAVERKQAGLEMEIDNAKKRLAELEAQVK